MTNNLKISIEDLKFSVELGDIDFNRAPQTTEYSLLGQERAIQALQFGIAMAHPGYNIYVMGETGTGKLSLVQQQLQRGTENKEVVCPYAYVNNFKAIKEPKVIKLPHGQEQTINFEIEILLDDILSTVPAAFESPSYQQQQNILEQHFDRLYTQALAEVEKTAATNQIALFRDNNGITFSPVKDGGVLDEDTFASLSQQERDRFHQQVSKLQEQLSEQLLHLPQWRRETSEKLQQLNIDTLNNAITPLFEILLQRYCECQPLIAYLKDMQQDLVRFTLKDLLLQESGIDISELKDKRDRLIARYLPNIVIHSHPETQKPSIYEAHPTLQNIFGRIEYSHDQGLLSSSNRDILPGSLHRANGGYLILDAVKLLEQPEVWEALKRAVKSATFTIEQGSDIQDASLSSLKPDRIPLSIKVILIGSRDIYYLLQEADNEFDEMFRVLADFDDYFYCNSEHLQNFAQLTVRHYRKLADKPMDHSAIIELIKHSTRLAEHQQRLSARVNETLEIITEAEYYRNQSQADSLQHSHVKAALTAREQRSGRIAQTLLDEMLDGTILIECTGTAVGKVNGLTVLDVGDSSSGAPTRITATVHPGSKGVVDIEREADLGQSIHSKGVLILTGYLGHCYAQHFPFSFSASIAIEQSYGYIDGDSASLAELCALISALTEIPLKQNLALTGSINQYGEVQAIGGVNEKIEGFFSLCQARQLTGDQGVIIPDANRQNLILNDAVLEAIAQQRFSIYAVEHVDQALSLMTGMEIGISNEKDEYPEHSLNHRIISRLKQITDISSEKEEHEHSEQDQDQEKSENNNA